MENVVILGTGIAGLTAAVYTARADLSPLLISGPENGGQLTLTTNVENFPGFLNGIDGPELVNIAKHQAEKFGARFKEEVAIEFHHSGKKIELVMSGGEKIETKALIIATGASARWLGIPSEEKYKGRGVTTCATCDGAFFRGKEVVVVGGGDSAMEEALFLTKFVRKVTVIVRRDKLKASRIMQDRFFKNEKTAIIWNSTVEEIIGDGKYVKAVKLKNNATGKSTEFKCDGVFLAIGHAPNTSIFSGKLKMDGEGYILVDENKKTNIPGVFAAGDVQDRRYRQAITAAGSGCQAAIEVEKYLVAEHK